MPDLERVQHLLEEALDGLDNEDWSTARVLRRCIRIATLRADTAALLWLELEASDLANTDKEAALTRRDELLGHMDSTDAAELTVNTGRAYIARRTLPGDDKNMFGDSVEQLGNRIRHLREQVATLTTPDGLHPVDLYHRSDALGAAKIEVLGTVHNIQQVLDRIRAALHTFLVQTEQELEYGRVNAEIFEKTRTFVDRQLHQLAPEALEQFQSAYRRVNEGDAEALSQALTSCRRILKTVADQLCPPSQDKFIGTDGKEHGLTDDRYINRLLKLVQDSLAGHGSGDVVSSTLDSLGQRLRALDGLASKGVHAKVNATEVDTCVVQTYLMVGEVLRINAGTSPHDARLPADPVGDRASEPGSR